MTQNTSLKPYNSFAIDVYAVAFEQIKSETQLLELLNKTNSKPSLILGGGSNILFTKDIEGLVLQNSIPGVEVISESSENAIVRAGAGVVWHDLVCWTIEQQLYGIENLSLIPGLVGAAPVQNIGAYGVELKDCFHALSAYDFQSGTIERFEGPESCKFAYRDSIFKQQRERWFITQVELKLSKKEQLNISYASLKKSLEEKENEINQKSVAETVIAIRSQKLPDPNVIGNAGSFFKNPIVSEGLFLEIKEKHPTVVSYPVGDKQKKLAAGWLIENCGWKGKRVGDAGVHDKQALVLVNHGQAKGSDIAQLARDIQEDVNIKHGVQLEAEVRIL